MSTSAATVLETKVASTEDAISQFRLIHQINTKSRLLCQEVNVFQSAIEAIRVIHEKRINTIAEAGFDMTENQLKEKLAATPSYIGAKIYMSFHVDFSENRPKFEHATHALFLFENGGFSRLWPDQADEEGQAVDEITAQKLTKRMSSAGITAARVFITVPLDVLDI